MPSSSQFQCLCYIIILSVHFNSVLCVESPTPEPTSGPTRSSPTFTAGGYYNNIASPTPAMSVTPTPAPSGASNGGYGGQGGYGGYYSYQSPTPTATPTSKSSTPTPTVVQPTTQPTSSQPSGTPSPSASGTQSPTSNAPTPSTAPTPAAPTPSINAPTRTPTIAPTIYISSSLITPNDDLYNLYSSASVANKTVISNGLCSSIVSAFLSQIPIGASASCTIIDIIKGSSIVVATTAIQNASATSVTSATTGLNASVLTSNINKNLVSNKSLTGIIPESSLNSVATFAQVLPPTTAPTVASSSTPFAWPTIFDGSITLLPGVIMKWKVLLAEQSDQGANEISIEISGYTTQCGTTNCYFAVGFGGKLMRSRPDIYIGFFDAYKGAVVMDCKSSGNVVPSVDSTINLLPGSTTIVVDDTMIVRFRRKLNTLDTDGDTIITLDKPMDIVFSYGPVIGGSPSQHCSMCRGTISWMANTPVIPTPTVASTIVPTSLATATPTAVIVGTTTIIFSFILASSNPFKAYQAASITDKVIMISHYCRAVTSSFTAANYRDAVYWICKLMSVYQGSTGVSLLLTVPKAIASNVITTSQTANLKQGISTNLAANTALVNSIGADVTVISVTATMNGGHVFIFSISMICILANLRILIY